MASKTQSLPQPSVLHASITTHNENTTHTTRYASCVFRAAFSLCAVMNACSTDDCDNDYLLGVQIRLCCKKKLGSMK